MCFYDIVGENLDEFKVVIGVLIGKVVYNIKGNILYFIFSILVSYFLKIYMFFDYSILNMFRCCFIKFRLFIVDEILMVGFICLILLIIGYRKYFVLKKYLVGFFCF